MYRTTQAAKYVGMKFSSFVYHIQEGHVKEDYRIKGERVFRKETLDAFKAKHAAVSGMTKEDIAAKYGQEIPVVRGHLRRKDVKPIAKTGKSFLYNPRDIEELARQVGWSEKVFKGDSNAVSA